MQVAPQAELRQTRTTPNKKGLRSRSHLAWPWSEQEGVVEPKTWAGHQAEDKQGTRTVIGTRQAPPPQSDPSLDEPAPGAPNAYPA